MILKELAPADSETDREPHDAGCQIVGSRIAFLVFEWMIHDWESGGGRRLLVRANHPKMRARVPKTRSRLVMIG